MTIPAARQAGHKQVSRFGQYRGYSQAIYDGYERRSQYLALGDGTRLAYDLLLPTKDGVPADEPLPTTENNDGHKDRTGVGGDR
jgi:hypothetical protein